eukprot:TRINITY_DN17017_c0_g1_i1.p1 TRINITY_DN17017_c0_g1~~TRINITY_DN17017_c0_g1_i1.p1  ORF type:complete len:201 (+),score=32.07 TRINITY_DN17017_c0_g1_i1:82-684(+)
MATPNQDDDSHLSKWRWGNFGKPIPGEKRWADPDGTFAPLQKPEPHMVIVELHIRTGPLAVDERLKYTLDADRETLCMLTGELRARRLLPVGCVAVYYLQDAAGLRKPSDDRRVRVGAELSDKKALTTLGLGHFPLLKIGCEFKCATCRNAAGICSCYYDEEGDDELSQQECSEDAAAMGEDLELAGRFQYRHPDDAQGM